MSRRPRPRRSRGPVGPAKAVRLVRDLTLIVVAFAVLAGILLGWTYLGPGPRAREGGETSVVLERGEGLVRIAEALDEAGVIRSAGLFVTAAKLTGAATELKAGEYLFPSRVRMGRVLSDIRQGKVVRRFVTVPEGWTSAMAADAVTRETVLTGVVETPPEGVLLPDTYQIERGDDRNAVLRRMRRAQDRLLADLWAKRQPGLPFKTPMEAVTMASIVEKETALPAERPRIAAVFINRLRTGMRIESDPTVIYGVSQGRPLGRGLTVNELAQATPYNTYRIDGLPPTPIANPGKAALAAVLNPPMSTEVFFVADGTGGHVFASTYAEHEKNVARWRQIERRAAQAAQ